MDSKPTRVLLIEGDADDEALIASYLASPEVDLVRAPRLSTACHLLAKESFDAVLLDLALPQTDGVEGFLKVRSLRPELPVIILTGARDEVLAARAVKLGAQDYFIKGSPDCHLLRRAVRYAVERASRADDAAMEARNHFLGRISHELRNTLATMKTAAYCLKDDSGEKLSARQAQMVDMISRNIDRQTRIVENILDLARLRSGKLKMQFRRADAAAIVAELADEYKLSRGAQRLHLDVEGGLPPLDCDPDLIAQVLRNLLDNAARYAKEKIAIAASRSDDGIAFSVTDDGAGIPEDRLGGLFTPFSRVDDGEHQNGRKGTGLGLAICREIIEGHHGRIRAENAAGAGACFTFVLPAGGAAAAPGKRSYALHK
ncbi:MAG: ATP-binding protein [Elusimicrobiota bacterium]|nr:ATP-binding protein [Elusimicrobiota bacterium]